MFQSPPAMSSIFSSGHAHGSHNNSSHNKNSSSNQRYISLQAVKIRMKSVTNIKKITAAMKMVAASKLRAVEDKMRMSRGIVVPFVNLVGDLPAAAAEEPVTVLITSDRGLCGGINSTIAKTYRAMDKVTKAINEENSEGGSGSEKKNLVLVGEKIKALLQRDSSDAFRMHITDCLKSGITFGLASAIADEIIKMNTNANSDDSSSGEFDVAHIVFNKFGSVMSFIPTIATVLSPEGIEKFADIARLDQYEIDEDDREELFQNFCEFQVGAQMFNALLENASSEMASRMSAMDSSTRNASEMLEKLTLTYNRTRQAAITTELIEIISGASALDES